MNRQKPWWFNTAIITLVNLCAVIHVQNISQYVFNRALNEFERNSYHCVRDEAMKVGFELLATTQLPGMLKWSSSCSVIIFSLYVSILCKLSHWQ